MDLTLERVGHVAEKMGLLPVKVPSFIVAGTNGKGTTITLMDALLRAKNKKTGLLTSPHLLHFKPPLDHIGRFRELLQ